MTFRLVGQVLPPLLFLACAGQPKQTAQQPGTSAGLPDKVAQVEDCSWERVRAGNDEVSAGHFDAALDIFMRCPSKNLPNLVGLAADYAPAKQRLVALADTLEKRIRPPKFDKDLDLLVNILDALKLYDRLHRVFQQYVAAGFDETNHGWVFYVELARGGCYEDALRSEPLYQGFVRRAIDEYRTCPSDDPLSSVGLMLAGAMRDYLLPLVGVGRVADGACLLHLFETVAPGLAASATSELVEEVCSKQSDPSACKETLQRQYEASKECPAWMAATYSEQGEGDSGGSETEVGTTTETSEPHP